MKLSKDQIRIAKSTTLYAVAIIVLLPLVRHLMGTPFCWGDALVSAGAIILGALIIGVLLKISGKEKLTTPAGTFDCFIMEETVTTKAMMQKEVEKTVSWYAYGVGLVKESTYDKKGKLVSTTLLNRINW